MLEDEYFGEMPEDMFGMYGIVDIKVEKIKDKYKDKKNFENFLYFYNCFEKMEGFNTHFNSVIFLFSYSLILISILIFGGLGEIFLLGLLFAILIYSIKSTIYLKIKEAKIDNIYRNGYFIKGFGVKDDTYCNIDHISVNIENLHLELEKKLEICFNYKIVDDTIYSFNDIQKPKKKRWIF